MEHLLNLPSGAFRMSLLFSALVTLPPALLLAIGSTSSRYADSHVRMMRPIAVTVMAIAFACSIASAGLLAYLGPIDIEFVRCTWPLPLNIGVYFDSLSSIMMLLISYIGLIIVRFSTRYLNGELTQGRFFRWILFTLGSVLLMVVSRNLIMFGIAWMLTSIGLHKLLTHYPDRSWAVWAARKKFLISRFGDLLLLIALGLTYYCFHSFDYSDVFAGAKQLSGSTEGTSGMLSWIGTLFVIGAMTKSAQFPFHSWLPDTLETPTPVSALMHAGVINAGGFLVIRLSPLVSQSHSAMDFLAMVGAFTALLGGVIMLTQTSVKRALAYSTMAQMGFMMLQCGLGAFSAALLHILAHSLYKAHAFLSSGSVLESAERTRTLNSPKFVGAYALSLLPFAVCIAIALESASMQMLGIDFASKPGSLVLGFILTLAITQLVWNALATGMWEVASKGVVAAGLLSWFYLCGWLVVDHLLSTTVSHQIIEPSRFDFVVMGFVSVGFVAVFSLQAFANRWPNSVALQSLYVHATNGFYLDIPARRLTARVWGSAGPTP